MIKGNACREGNRQKASKEWSVARPQCKSNLKEGERERSLGEAPYTALKSLAGLMKLLGSP